MISFLRRKKKFEKRKQQLKDFERNLLEFISKNATIQSTKQLTIYDFQIFMNAKF